MQLIRVKQPKRIRLSPAEFLRTQFSSKQNVVGVLTQTDLEYQALEFSTKYFWVLYTNDEDWIFIDYLQDRFASSQNNQFPASAVTKNLQNLQYESIQKLFG